MDNLTGNVSIPRMTQANTATWAPENAQIARTAPTFDQVESMPHRCGVVTAYSKQLLAQSAIDVDNVLKDDILRVMGVGLDRAILNGTGSANNQPNGILTVGANTVGNYNVNLRSPNQAFGGPEAYNSLVQFAGALEDANFENDGTFGFVVSPKTKARLKCIPAAVNYPRYLWEGRPSRNAVGLGQYGGWVSKADGRSATRPSFVREMVRVLHI
jgi:HK97 family phage major capsid protein